MHLFSIYVQSSIRVEYSTVLIKFESWFAYIRYNSIVSHIFPYPVIFLLIGIASKTNTKDSCAAVNPRIHFRFLSSKDGHRDCRMNHIYFPITRSE